VLRAVVAGWVGHCLGQWRRRKASSGCRRRPLLSRLSQRRRRRSTAIFQGSIRVSWHSSDARSVPTMRPADSSGMRNFRRRLTLFLIGCSHAARSGPVRSGPAFISCTSRCRRNDTKEIAKITACLAISCSHRALGDYFNDTVTRQK